MQKRIQEPYKRTEQTKRPKSPAVEEPDGGRYPVWRCWPDTPEPARQQKSAKQHNSIMKTAFSAADHTKQITGNQRRQNKPSPKTHWPDCWRSRILAVKCSCGAITLPAVFRAIAKASSMQGSKTVTKLLPNARIKIQIAVSTKPDDRNPLMPDSVGHYAYHQRGNRQRT